MFFFKWLVLSYMLHASYLALQHAILCLHLTRGFKREIILLHLDFICLNSLYAIFLFDKKKYVSSSPFQIKAYVCLLFTFYQGQSILKFCSIEKKRRNSYFLYINLGNQKVDFFLFCCLNKFLINNNLF